MTWIAVTGGSGKLGRAVVTDLLEHGYQVVNLDRVPSPGASAVYVKVDFTDYGQTFEALHAIEDRYPHIDAVVHLAAIPAPGLTTNAATFDNNITSTHHVFAAARACRHQANRLGLQRDRARPADGAGQSAALPAGRRGVPPAAWSPRIRCPRRSRRRWRCSSADGIRN